MENILQLDTEWFRWVNGHNAAWLDGPMWFFSQGWTWSIPIVAVFMFATLRTEPKRWWLPVVGVCLCFLFADQISVHLCKNIFHRLRPCHALDDVTMYRTNCAGLYGFVSSHAANAFAVVVFLVLRYAKKMKPSWPLAVVLLAWAAIVGYSRIYLGKHYPGDVICGALLGSAIGWGVWWLVGLIERKFLKKNAQK